MDLVFRRKGTEMDYLSTFEDGSEALSHHGVKGMKWGVWNAETRQRYTLQKGSNVRRLTSEHEAAKGTDLSKRFYVSQNQQDYDMYRKSIDNLPATELRYKEPGAIEKLINPLASNKIINKNIGLITYEAVDDVTVAKGKKVLDDILKEYGSTKLSDVFDDTGAAEDREQLGLSGDLTFSKVYRNKAISEEVKKAAARSLVADVLGATSEDSGRYLRRNGEYQLVESPGKKLYESYRKQGYDAIEDLEDQLSTSKNFQPQAPLVVLNGNKFKIVESKIVDRNDISR